jgi:uncharacterized lipoprotein YajG
MNRSYLTLLVLLLAGCQTSQPTTSVVVGVEGEDPRKPHYTAKIEVKILGPTRDRP